MVAAAAVALEAQEKALDKRARFAAVRELLAKKGMLAPEWPVAPDLGAPAREPDAIATGVESIDALLPGGFPRRAVSEVTGPRACGKTTLVARAAATVTAARRLVAWIDPAGEAYPPAFARLGVTLSRLLWVRPCAVDSADLEKNSLWAAEVLLQSTAFDLVVLDASRLGFDDATRPPRERASARMALERRAVVLRTAAEAAGASLVLLGETSLPTPGAPPALSLALTPGHARILRSRWGTTGHNVKAEVKAGP